ncbi:hypothetical protein [Atopobium sp. oral taxon 416]|uniref:hypothetical protein n=1 Tax=Atopobium sp. oral taxon 416 TaxID=712157 RepID=UPI001BA64E74|nr:hypothetical protein [Atopobium sp. oral taxon 416]QUC04336.1 hypothetical protein J4859_05220 [Atopobium sp. oral taxon 416]
MNLGIYSYWSCLTTLISAFLGSTRNVFYVDAVALKQAVLKMVVLADLLPVLVALPLVLGRCEHTLSQR